MANDSSIHSAMNTVTQNPQVVGTSLSIKEQLYWCANCWKKTRHNYKVHFLSFIFLVNLVQRLQVYIHTKWLISHFLFCKWRESSYSEFSIILYRLIYSVFQLIKAVQPKCLAVLMNHFCYANCSNNSPTSLDFLDFQHSNGQ